MKKHAFFPVFAIVGGIVAFVLRLLQNRTGFESYTGLPISGNVPGLLLVVWLIALTVLLVLLTRCLPKECDAGPAFPAAFAASEPKLLVLPVMGILLMALAGLADLYESFGLGNLLVQLQSAANPYAEISAAASGFSGKLQLLLGIFSLASAAALFLSVTACRKANTAYSPSLLLVPPVVLVVRLVLTYRLDSVNPALEAYYVELLALVFLTLGFYRLSSFAFQAGRTNRFFLYSCAAVILSFASLADVGPHLSTLLVYAGGAVTLLGFLLLRLSHMEDDA